MSKLADQIAPFVLASTSPRRRDLLGGLGLSFDVMPSQVCEDPLAGESPAVYVRRLAHAKASEVARTQRTRGDSRTIVAADTIVVVDGAALGKPTDENQARVMLESLAGRAHHVITGFCVLTSDGREYREEVTTEVCFKPMSPAEIEGYLETGEWRDKAGGYAIQGYAAYLVRLVKGSYTNVVGLPLCEVVEALQQVGPAKGSEEGS